MTKAWECIYENHRIRVENSWIRGERLIVDEKLLDEQLGAGVRSRLHGRIPNSENERGHIKVSLGGWFFIHCRVFVDDQLLECNRVSL